MNEETTHEPRIDAASPGVMATASPDQSERNWAVAAHLASVAGWVGIPFGNILAPLVVWLLKRGDSEFVRSQSVESLNFQISMTVYALVAGAVGATVIGLIVAIPVFLAVVIGDLIFTILGAIRVSNGVAYRYPLTIRLIS